jgi:HEAT repeat protein
LQSGFEEPGPSEIVLAPRARVLLLGRRIGEEAVAGWCAELLSGAVPNDDPRRPSIKWLGGRHAALELKVGRVDERGQDYWPRVWAARGLLYVWRPEAEPAVLAGLRDPAWRVREMCAKVVRSRALHRAEPVLTHLLDDRVPRVRAAAEAALTESARSPE